MNEFGDFANIDVDKLINGAQERYARMQTMQERLSELSGHGADENGLVKAVYSTKEGLAELEIDPRAMRKGSKELAETIKDVIRTATDDLQRQIKEVTAEALGQSELADLAFDKDASIAKAQEAQRAFQRTMNDAMGELDRIRKTLGL